MREDWRANWEKSVARALQGLEDGAPKNKNVTIRKPKISVNVNVTIKGRTTASCVSYPIIPSFSDLFFSEKSHPISGPSDVGGSCPEGTKLYTETDVEYCCCGDGCCWDRCKWREPPENDCLPPGAVWQQDDNTGHFHAMGKGSYIPSILIQSSMKCDFPQQVWLVSTTTRLLSPNGLRERLKRGRELRIRLLKQRGPIATGTPGYSAG